MSTHDTTNGDRTIEMTAPSQEPAAEQRGPFRQDRDKLATQLAVGLIVLGFILMGAAWFGASGRNFLQQQFPYLLSGSIPGLALVILGGGILFVRDIRRERDVIEAQITRLASVVEELAERSAAPAYRPAAHGANGLVLLGRTRFHRPDCRLVQGKDGIEAATRAEATDRGLEPCRTCEP